MSNGWQGPLEKIDDYRWKIPKSYMSGMRVPGIIYADENLLKSIRRDRAPQQVANAAHLPGIVKYSLAMPDIHWGYGLSIGGVVATDVEAGGVVTPGGVGYDINCLDGDSKILLDNGAYIRIKDFEKKFNQRELSCINFERKSKEETSIARFMKIKPSNPVFEVKTLNGNKIIATEDHPFWTPDGMIPLKSLNIEDVVAVYPFEGVPYEEPSDEIIIDEANIKKFLLSIGKDSRGSGLEQIIIQLRKRGLLPLRYNSPQLSYVLKIMGYNFGDGNIFFTNRSKKGFTWFYGTKEDLEKIKHDIEKIGFRSKVHSRVRDHEINTMYSKVKFRAETFSCKVSSNGFAALLVCLGIPLGAKTSQAFRVPKWIMKAPLWQKRLFLAGFFGAEMPSPGTLTDHGYNFYCPTISMNRHKEFVKNGKEFLTDLSDLLEEFNVSTINISEGVEHKDKDGKVSIRLRLQLSNKANHLINLYSKVGFEYNQKRNMLSNVAVQYLKMKESVIRKRERLANKARELATAGIGAKSVYKELDTDFVNTRFIQRSIYEGGKNRPRFFGTDAITFDEFFEYTTGGMDNSGMVWDTIETIREIEFDGYVYDFTVKHRDHNFIANNFVVSNCGVRLMRTNLTEKEIRSNLDNLVHALFSKIPAGVGSKSDIKVSDAEERQIMIKGARWAVEKRGFGTKEDLEHTEDKGCMEGADPNKVSERAFERGRKQSGTLGSGNHFLEVQVVDEVYDKEAASIFHITKGSITVMVHCGSRGFGYQICDEYSKNMIKCLSKYNISVPDRQLACTPITSPEGKNYIGAMKCAANYAWNNRQCLMHRIRGVFERVFEASQKDLGMSLIWDVAHNIGKFEKYNIDGKKRLLFIHRKGATRAFGPDNPAVPEIYRKIGQPVIIPGDMGRNSYLLVGTKKAEEESFGSTCHGSGRLMSRKAAIHAEGRHTLFRDLEAKGIKVMAAGRGTLAEEAPYAYKDVNEVVDVVHKAGISKKVCRMKPIGVIKG